MKVIVFDIGGTLMKYKNMPLSWLDFYKDGFRYVRNKLDLNITENDIDKSFEVLKSYNPRINPREVNVTPEVIFSEAVAHWQKDIKTAKRFVLIDRRSKNADFGQDYTVTDLTGIWEVMK